MILPRLATDRLVLRPAVMEDADAIVAIIRDEAVARWLSRVPWPYDRDNAVAWIEGAATAAAAGEEAAFAIDHGGALIGMIGLRNLGDTPELGYWLGRDRWGKGLATEAVGAVLAHAFGPLAASDIRSGVFDGNAASLAIQRKFGFVVTGERLAHSEFHNRPLRHIDTLLTRDAYFERQP